MPNIAIVCPVYQEEEVILDFHARLKSALTALPAQYRIKIIYVVDPSSDRTEQLLAQLTEQEVDVTVLVLSRRFGHQAALLAGMDESDADALITLDSDLQHPPELIPELITLWEKGHDIVQTIRQDDHHIPWLKRLSSRWFYRLLFRIGSIDLPPGAADFRLLSRRVVEVFRTEFSERNPFLRGLFNWMGYRVAHVPFQVEQRPAGHSKYSVRRLFRFASHGILSFSKFPLRLCTVTGLLLALLSLLFAGVQITFYVVGSTTVPGWATLIGMVGFIGGVQLLFLGVIGEYLAIIFDEVKRRPRYLIDRRYDNHALQPKTPSG